MVSTEALKSADIPMPVEPSDLPEEELRWCTVTLQEVLRRGSRLEASVFDVEGKHAREVLEGCKWDTKPLFGNGGMARDAFYPGRFKRNYCSNHEPGATGFLGNAEMLGIQPKPVKYMAFGTARAKAVQVSSGWVLLSRSGTIGNVTYVSETLERYLVSEHAIRIVADYPGYLYAFLRTDIGKALVMSAIYGAVVDQVEPEHLESVPIADPPPVLKKRIHDLVVKSYALRDESNALLEKAERLLYDALNLPPLSKVRPRYFDKTADLRNYAVKLSLLSGRLDASYHVPIVAAILQRLKKEAAEITTIDDPRISKRIILPGRFARVYVQEGQGTVFFGGKQLYELDPANKKYLSLAKHGKRIRRELVLTENMTLITRSGTVGKVALVPGHWANWVANEHIIRVEPASADIAGYLYVFLATDYGWELITRFTYGAVVDEIDDHQVSQIPIPLLKDATTQAEINRLALEANAKRTEAYRTEQEAIRITNNEVIHAYENQAI